MTSAEFYSLVSEMRNAQREYFRTRSKESLMKSKALEKRVDDALSGQGTFFDGMEGGAK